METPQLRALLVHIYRSGQQEAMQTIEQVAAEFDNMKSTINRLTGPAATSETEMSKLRGDLVEASAALLDMGKKLALKNGVIEDHSRTILGLREQVAFYAEEKRKETIASCDQSNQLRELTDLCAERGKKIDQLQKIIARQRRANNNLRANARDAERLHLQRETEVLRRFEAQLKHDLRHRYWRGIETAMDDIAKIRAQVKGEKEAPTTGFVAKDVAPTSDAKPAYEVSGFGRWNTSPMHDVLADNGRVMGNVKEPERFVHPHAHSNAVHQRAAQGPATKVCTACNGSTIVPGQGEYTVDRCKECVDGLVGATPQGERLHPSSSDVHVKWSNPGVVGKDIGIANVTCKACHTEASMMTSVEPGLHTCRRYAAREWTWFVGNDGAIQLCRNGKVVTSNDTAIAGRIADLLNKHGIEGRA